MYIIYIYIYIDCEKEDEVLTLSFVDHPKMEVNICQFAERRHILNHTRYSEEVYLYLKGRCTTCREPGEFWAYQTHNRNEGPKQSICGRCYNWNMGMPGLLEKCQSSTCVCGDNGQCVSCKNRSDFKFYNRQGEWKYCYGRCEGNLSSGVLSFKGHGKHHKTECHLYGIYIIYIYIYIIYRLQRWLDPCSKRKKKRKVQEFCL